MFVAHCRRDLGMHSREIPDSAITASSAYDERSVGPINARSLSDPCRINRIRIIANAYKTGLFTVFVN